MRSKGITRSVRPTGTPRCRARTRVPSPRYHLPWLDDAKKKNSVKPGTGPRRSAETVFNGLYRVFKGRTGFFADLPRGQGKRATGSAAISDALPLDGPVRCRHRRPLAAATPRGVDTCRLFPRSSPFVRPNLRPVRSFSIPLLPNPILFLVFLRFTVFYWVLLGFIKFYWVLPSFTGFLPSFNGFYWVLLTFTGFY